MKEDEKYGTLSEHAFGKVTTHKHKYLIDVAE